MILNRKTHECCTTLDLEAEWMDGWMDGRVQLSLRGARISHCQEVEIRCLGNMVRVLIYRAIGKEQCVERANKGTTWLRKDSCDI